MSNFIKRVITGIVLIVFVVSTIWFNRYTKLLTMLLFSNISIYELNNAFKNMQHDGMPEIAYVFNSLFLLASFRVNIQIAFPLFTIYILFLFIILVLDEKTDLDKIMANIFFAVYITFAYAYLLFLDRNWTLFAFAITAFTDTFAYLVGSTVGRTKLIERLSPKKTVEGFIGGMLGGLLLAVIYVVLFDIEYEYTIYISAILISVVSQIGDLLASYIKRKSGIKDYGSILVGHGGIMDRFDSLLLVAPLVYLLVYNLR